MKLFLLSAFGALIAMSVAEPPAPAGLERQLQKLQQVADERSRLFNELLGNERQPAELGEVPALEGSSSGENSRRPAGLRMGGLGKSSLQPASGLQGGARGLTPEDEWRKMFPHKPGYSR